VLSPRESIALAIASVEGNVTYEWSASAGVVTPPSGPTVTYMAPDNTGQVIITVVGRRGNESSSSSHHLHGSGHTHSDSYTDRYTHTNDHPFFYPHSDPDQHCDPDASAKSHIVHQPLHH
jgi:hypothetical protein